mmetsp:Transcript_29701/g.95929  ORF Transcript_29701/g.95929 Transcript_29701/m.95929 type:complete len:212 (-) Transcript_29701:484-1119(-)
MRSLLAYRCLLRSSSTSSGRTCGGCRPSRRRSPSSLSTRSSGRVACRCPPSWNSTTTCGGRWCGLARTGWLWRPTRPRGRSRRRHWRPGWRRSRRPSSKGRARSSSSSTQRGRCGGCQRWRLERLWLSWLGCPTWASLPLLAQPLLERRRSTTTPSPPAGSRSATLAPLAPRAGISSWIHQACSTGQTTSATRWRASPWRRSSCSRLRLCL